MVSESIIDLLLSQDLFYSICLSTLQMSNLMCEGGGGGEIPIIPLVSVDYSCPIIPYCRCSVTSWFCWDELGRNPKFKTILESIIDFLLGQDLFYSTRLSHSRCPVFDVRGRVEIPVFPPLSVYTTDVHS